jgi:hypothetical protein
MEGMWMSRRQSSPSPPPSSSSSSSIQIVSSVLTRCSLILPEFVLSSLIRVVGNGLVSFGESVFFCRHVEISEINIYTIQGILAVQEL